MSCEYKNWELFYCDIEKPKKPGDKDDFVDLLSIDSKHKRYILDVYTDIRNTDGYRVEDDSEIISAYMSRDLLHILLDGLKHNGYKEYTEKEPDK